MEIVSRYSFWGVAANEKLSTGLIRTKDYGRDHDLALE